MTSDPSSTVERTSRRGLRFGVRGTGPAVVLLHGWCLSRRMWMYLEDGLVAQGRTVVTPDLAGYGDSASLAAHDSLGGHGADVADLLDELGLEEAVVAGFAFGAGVALSLPTFERVGGIVAVGVPSAAAASYDRMPAAIRKDWPLFALRSAKAIVSRPLSDPSVEWLAGIFGRTAIPSALAGVEILRTFEPTELEQRWSVPTVFVHGADDPIVPPAVGRACAEAFGGRFVEVPDCGHLVPVDQRAALHDAVVELSDRLVAPR